MIDDDVSSETTQKQRVIGRPFQPGNPGRPKGSRNKIQEDFFADVLAAWEEKGKAAIDEMIADKPGEFVKMVAGLMPKEATLTINDNSDLSDDELADRIKQLAAQLAPFLIDGNGGAAADTGNPASPAKPARVH